MTYLAEWPSLCDGRGGGKLDAKHQASTWQAQGGKQPPGPGGMFHDEGVTFDLHAALLERLR